MYPEEVNRDPARIHGADEMWTSALNRLDKIVAYIRTMEPDIYTAAGENHDSSVLYDWLKGYIMIAETRGGRVARQTTTLMCAAALTKLVRAPRTDDPLAQLDWKEPEDDDQH
jgi:hypothetical protein